MKLLSALALAAASMCLSLSATAQWQWLDKDGSKVFSDRAPPFDVPEKNIIKRPVGSSRPVSSAAAATSAGPAAAASAATKAGAALPRLAGTDKDLEEKKKQAEDAAAAKTRAEQEKVAKARAENCTRARQSKADFDSGMRIARTNANGEREFLDDNSRAAEASRLQQIIGSDCG